MVLTELSRTGVCVLLLQGCQGFRILCKDVNICSQTTGIFPPTNILGRCLVPGKIPQKGNKVNCLAWDVSGAQSKVVFIFFYSISGEKLGSKTLSIKIGVARKLLVNNWKLFSNVSKNFIILLESHGPSSDL